MNAGELVISLLLKSGSFARQLQAAQQSLDEMGAAGEAAMSNVASAAAEMGRASENAARDAAESMRKLGRNAHDAGKNLQDAAKKGDSAFQALIPTLAKVAGFVGVALSVKSMVSTYLDQADALGKYSDALNVNMEEVQAWEEAVKHAGGSGDEFRASLLGLTQRLTEAAALGAGEMTESLRALGISAKDAAGKTKSALDFLHELAEKFERMSASDAAGFGQKLGLDKGTIMLLQQGRKATEEAIKAGREHIKFTKADADAAARANDAMQDMQTAFMSLAMRAIAPFIPLMTLAANILHDFAQWCSQNQEAVAAFFTAIAIVAGVKAVPALLKMGNALSLLRLAFGPVGIAVMFLAGLFDELWAFITGGDSIIERFALKMGVSKEALESIRGVLQSVIGFFLDLWEAITGDGADADAAWNRVKATFESAKEYLAGLIKSIKAWFAGLIPDWAKRLAGGGSSGKEKADPNGGWASPGALASGQAGNVDNSRNIQADTSISQIIVNTQATDAQGIASDIGSAIRRNQSAQIDTALF